MNLKKAFVEGFFLTLTLAMVAQGAMAWDQHEFRRRPAPPRPQQWTFCAYENQTCYVPSDGATVRYGANGRFHTLHVTGSVPCRNSVFGDPIYGVQKYCEFLADPRDPGYDDGTWEFCANENQTCYVPFYTNVRYGVPGRYYFVRTSGNIPCTNSYFGDPAYGQQKACFYQVR